MARHSGTAQFLLALLLADAGAVKGDTAEAQEASSNEAQRPPRPFVIQLPTVEEKRVDAEAPTAAVRETEDGGGGHEPRMTVAPGANPEPPTTANSAPTPATSPGYGAAAPGAKPS
ncbi:hypothetical protein D1007_49130 [Hordeum vulgare]|nr:hypothetical protein D1007_49130 [Hordeum vulgare]